MLKFTGRFKATTIKGFNIKSNNLKIKYNILRCQILNQTRCTPIEQISLTKSLSRQQTLFIAVFQWVADRKTQPPSDKHLQLRALRVIACALIQAALKRHLAYESTRHAFEYSASILNGQNHHDHAMMCSNPDDVSALSSSCAIPTQQYATNSVDTSII